MPAKRINPIWSVVRQMPGYEMILADQKDKLVRTQGKFLILWEKVRPGQGFRKQMF